MRALACFVLASTSFACEDVPIEVLTREPTRIYFYEDVAPSLARSCWCCHRTGGVAPSLLTPEEVGIHYDAVVASIADGTMPPLPTGTEVVRGCDTLRREAPRMSAADVATLVAWADGGYRPGDPAAAPPVPTECWPIAADEVIRIELPPQGLVDGERVARRCFVLDIAAPPERVVVRGRLVEAPSTFRSIIVYTDPYVDAAIPGERPCPLTYAPWAIDPVAGLWSGDDVMHVPQGTGIDLDDGKPLFVGVIYDNAFAGGDFESRPVVFELDTVSEVSVARRVAIASFPPEGVVLDPGSEATAGGELTFGAPVDVFGLGMQMHDFGDVAVAALGPDDAPHCVLAHRDWLPSDVRPVLFDPPFTAVSHARISCTYDLGDRTERVLEGPPPDGETCLLSLFVGTR